ncbi:MAG TPA: FtsL-like putative cell division protein [Candidatus Kapabacteria bacterium]|nr:FtsL-like putative cell division protein [Candidatus Kapabacteria bacterium]
MVRPFLRRWVTAAMLFAAAVLATLYIANAIAVNDLLGTISSLETEHDAVRNDNAQLRAELLRLMSVDRVTSLASSRLGMVQPAMPPQELGMQASATQASATQTPAAPPPAETDAMRNGVQRAGSAQTGSPHSGTAAGVAAHRAPAVHNGSASGTR